MSQCIHQPGEHHDVLVVLQSLFVCLESVVGPATDHMWEDPTPCGEWRVRELVNHITVELLWVPVHFDAENSTRSGRRFMGDVLGMNPTGMLHFAASNALNRFRGSGALDQTVRLSYGPRNGLGYARELGADLTVHWWDLARAVDSSRSLPRTVVNAALTEFRGYKNLAATGMFASPLPVPPGTSPLDELVSLSGRDPRWHSD
ncbi:TIGR03086 family metal-binding protein [Streptomyces sp. NPDC092307]|uniref:TIGR03086 family metal-binding protein n=1 Tax=Streptomyces sp. NPDC092307 TaxID=3366013 RepID=UPI0037FD2E0B